MTDRRAVRRSQSPVGQRRIERTAKHNESARGKLIKLPRAVAAIYRAVAALEKQYPGRKFTPDGHLVGSIGEVVAAEALKLQLYPMSQKGHDAFDADGDVQIKMTSKKTIAMYATSIRLVVLRVIPPDSAEIVYDGPGDPVWKKARHNPRNNQRTISLKKLQAVAAQISN